MLFKENEQNRRLSFTRSRKKIGMGLDKVSSAKRPGSTFTHNAIGNTLSAPFRQDSNITEIQSGSRQDGKAAPGDVGQFPCAKPTVDNFIQKKSASYLPNLDRNKAFSFN
jgi:hypothetical protein